MNGTQGKADFERGQERSQRTSESKSAQGVHDRDSSVGRLRKRSFWKMVHRVIGVS